jgi:poly(3-hydroxybutyrate) depolymerase
MGRRLPLHSWGWQGQIADLARMPDLVRHAKPWLHIDSRRIYAVGGSMGGQETLLLIGQHPGLLAGAAAFDSVTNLYTRYPDFALIRNGRRLQALARLEVGGTP